MRGGFHGVLLDAALDAFAVIGGLIAIWSGFLAGVALILRLDRDQLGYLINVGIAIGGIYGVPSAVVMFFLELGRVI